MLLVGMVSLYCVSVSKPVSSARSALGPLAQEPGPRGPGPGAWAPWPREQSHEGGCAGACIVKQVR